MTARTIFISGVTFCSFLAWAQSARAQTVSPGPYYATPSWDQTLTCTRSVFLGSVVENCPRLVVLSNMGNAAVLDRETGLVCERSPRAGTRNWLDARSLCAGSTTGSRMGWRLPRLEELRSLVDPSVSFPGPTLPSGHPFDGVQLSGDFHGYWTGTAVIGSNGLPGNAAYLVDFGAHDPTADLGGNKLDPNNFVWCVRGGQAADAQ